jgi:cytochrome oxidase Cu insertion factor (SCO1/SenC/PrrC family)
MAPRAPKLLVATAAVFLAAAVGAAGQAQPTDGGPFANFQESQLVFVPPFNVTQANGAVFDMVDGLKSVKMLFFCTDLQHCVYTYVCGCCMSPCGVSVVATCM